MTLTKIDKKEKEFDNDVQSGAYEHFYSKQRKLTKDMYATYKHFGKSTDKIAIKSK